MAFAAVRAEVRAALLLARFRICRVQMSQRAENLCRENPQMYRT